MADSTTADVNNASSIGPEVLGLPLITMLWLLAGVLAVVVGFTVSRRFHRDARDHQPGTVPATGTVLSIGDPS